MEKISLIIPVYNAEAYLRDCLESAIRQSYHNYEVLVVDDGSTDRSYEICKEYRDRCSFLRILHRGENRGLVYTWQEGVRAASGDYIAFMDSDDWVDSQYLEQLASGISEGAQIVCCNYNKVFPDRVFLVTERVAPGAYSEEQLHTQVFPKLLNNGSYLSRGISPHRVGKLFCKHLLLDNLQYTDGRISYGEDLNVFFAAILDCRKLMILDDRKGLYYYRQNDASIIYTYKKRMFEQIALLRNKLLEIMEKKGNYDFTDQINADFWCLFLEYVKNEVRSGNYFRSAGEVCRCFENSRKEIPCQKLTMKSTDSVLMFCLQRRLRGLVYIWMRLYSFAKKI